MSWQILAVIAFAVVLPIILFVVATRCVGDTNRPLVGQLGGPVIGAMAALFAAYAAFSGVQTQLALQRKALNFSQADAVATRLGRLTDLQLAARRLQQRIDTELQVPFAIGITPAADAADRDKQGQNYKTALDGTMADAIAFETAVTRSLVRPETQRAAANYMSAVRDLEYALTIAFGDLKNGDKVDARSKPQVAARFAQAQTAFDAFKQMLEFELEILKRRHDALIDESD